MKFVGSPTQISIGKELTPSLEQTGEGLDVRGENVRKIVIVEGPDNSGKSTLIELLVKTYRAIKGQDPHVEHSPSKLVVEGKHREWLQWIEDTLNRESDSIYDRHSIISEAVYGPILRDTDLLSTTRYLDRLKRLGPLIIYCKPPLERILETTKPEMEGVQERLKDLALSYDMHMTNLRLDGIQICVYDWTDRMSAQKALITFRNFFAVR